MRRVQSSVGEVIFDLISFILILIFFPFILILLSPFYFWRLIVKVLAKCFARNRLDKMLSELDAYFLFNDPRIETRPEFVISILVTLEGEVDLEQFKTNIVRDLVNARHENGDLIYSRLQQRTTTWMGFPFFEWIPNFNIHNHVMVLDMKVSDGNRHEFLSSRVRNPFPGDGSLWDVTLAPSINRTYVNLRVHHALCDGYSILKAIKTRGMKTNPNEFVFPRNIQQKQESYSQKVTKFYKNTVGMPGKFIRENMEMGRARPFRNPHSASFSGKVLVASTGKIPLYKFKRTKLRLGVPFTALVNSAISASLQNYLKKSESSSVKEFRINSFNGIAFVPMPRHPDDAILNWCGISDIKIPLKGEHLENRLEIANAQFKNTVTSSYATGHYYYLKVVGNLPVSLMKPLISQRSTGFLYTNMPGPTAPGHLWQNFLSEMMFWDPVIGSNGIAFSILSYNEYVKIGIAADSHVIKGIDKLQEMTEYIETELESIFNLEAV